jgi:N-acetylglucosamine repressor
MVKCIVRPDMHSAEAVRNVSRAEVLNVVRHQSPISVGEIAHRIPRSRATVSDIVREMLAVGLIRRVGLADSTGGRRPILLEYDPCAGVVVGATMFDNEVTAILTDLDGRPLRRHACAWSGLRPEDLLQSIIDAARIVSEGIEHSRILGIGIGLPGVIDVGRGTLDLCVSMGWTDGPVEARRIVEEALHMPAHIANRSRIAALGEVQTGVAQGMTDVLYVFIGRGIVAGIVLDNEIYFGAGSSAGEIGHNSVAPDGPLCKCGNRGCLEMYASADAITARAIARARVFPDSLMRSPDAVSGRRTVRGNLQALTIDDVIECARHGDVAAIETLDETGTYLGIALSAVLNTLNPQMLVLGGPVGIRAGALLLEPTVREIERRTLPSPLSSVRIVSGSSDTECAAVGAAALVLKNLPIERLFVSTAAPAVCSG